MVGDVVSYAYRLALRCNRFRLFIRYLATGLNRNLALEKLYAVGLAD
jgi:hypothetical protein